MSQFLQRLFTRQFQDVLNVQVIFSKHCKITVKKFFLYSFIFGCAGSSLLHCGCFLVAETRGSSPVVYRLLIAAASLVEPRLQGVRASVVAAQGPVVNSSQAPECRPVAVMPGLSWRMSMWDLPRPGIEQGSPSLQGGFLTTGPPRKSLIALCYDAAAAAAKSLQSCLTLCDPIDGSLPGSSVPGILQARTLEWVAICYNELIFKVLKQQISFY